MGNRGAIEAGSCDLLMIHCAVCPGCTGFFSEAVEISWNDILASSRFCSVDKTWNVEVAHGDVLISFKALVSIGLLANLSTLGCVFYNFSADYIVAEFLFL